MPKISQYPSVTLPQDADILVVVQGGVTKKVDLSTVKSYVGGSSSVPDPTAENDVLMGGNSPITWVKKTINQLKTALGLGSAAYTASTAYDAAGAATAAAAGKADKVAASPDPTGYVATFDASGNLAVSAQLISGIGNVSSEDFTDIVKCTQAEYDALSPADENTLYIIVG